MRFKDKVVVVTGGAGGIGQAISSSFVQEGAKVSILDNDQAGLSRVIAAIKGQFVAENTVYGYNCDITDSESVYDTINKIKGEHGQIDILVNNAGFDFFNLFINMNSQQWQRLISVNLVGILNVHHAVLPIMLRSGGGRIVNISSESARCGSEGESVYSACKGGIISFSKSLAREQAKNAITVNVVCPGPTDTAMLREYAQGIDEYSSVVANFEKIIPMGRIGQPGDLSGTVLFFASDAAAYITGQVLSVSGGMTMQD